MGSLDHPAQGRDADPLQDRHHRLRLCRLQHLLFVLLSLVARGMRFICSRFCSTVTARRRARSSRSGLAFWVTLGADRAGGRHHCCALSVLIVRSSIFAIAPRAGCGSHDGDGIGMIGRRGMHAELVPQRARRWPPACLSRRAGAEARATPMFRSKLAPSQAARRPNRPRRVQPAPSQVQASSAAAGSPTAFGARPGFIDAFGRWLEEGASKFKSDMQDAQEKFDQFGGQARRRRQGGDRRYHRALPKARTS